MTPATPTPPATVAPRVAVRSADAVHGVVAARRFAPGDHVLTFEGDFTDTPSRYSVQVGVGRHLVPPRDLDPRLDPVRFAWRFLNHSCRPNAAVRGVRLVAMRPVAPGEELTFDYNATEAVLAEPFECRCGHCGGRVIRGKDFEDGFPEARRGTPADG